jgi:hypothetical protein
MQLVPASKQQWPILSRIVAIPLEHLARPGAEVEAEAVTEPEAVATPVAEVPPTVPEAAPTSDPASGWRSRVRTQERLDRVLWLLMARVPAGRIAAELGITRADVDQIVAEVNGQADPDPDRIRFVLHSL